MPDACMQQKNRAVPPRRVAVFGGAGFLGSHLVEELLAQGHEVTVFNRARIGGVAFGNLTHLDGRYRAIVGEFEDEAAVSVALDGQDVAVDLIGDTSPVASWGDPLRTIEHELRPSVRFFELCAEKGVQKVVFASSGGSVYGQHGGVLDEGVAPHPFTPYSIVKLCAEHFLNYYREKHGLCSDCYRIGNLYGPRQRPKPEQGVVAVWIDQVMRGAPVDVYGDAQTVRDFVYVSDAAKLMTHSLRDLDSGDVYNLGSGKGTSLLELLRVLRQAIPGAIDCRMHGRRAGDGQGTVLDSTRLLQHFPGFRFTPLEEGIRRCLEFVARRAHPHGTGESLGLRNASGGLASRRC